ncbi:hypothetical protein PanWU01x14_313970 [Parasponia andersonii]|uniref:Uncharacterized protein n=1 Tax=Parasponia andersonii TaxID=3476 RepID=A0A2P5AP59_PARAD|nr:hypothetical protein PanWU01x14_313970 [Parasponia andersonii]
MNVISPISIVESLLMIEATKEEGHEVSVRGSLMLWKDVCALLEDMGLKLVSVVDKIENQSMARKKGKIKELHNL